ncbi:MAG TPA: Wzz/FepE/Etk N-terminal domain-containing protein, partial [Thermomonas sp.]|nr:Wzz/FepE/Etk N-terminal domain-containing protein [Thermomonas sp.]
MTQDRLPATSADASQQPSFYPALSQRETSALLVHELQQAERRDEDEIDLLAYWHILVKRRRLIASILIAVVAMALLATLMTTPIYRASVVMQIEKQGSQVIQVNGIQPENDMYGWDPDFL